VKSYYHATKKILVYCHFDLQSEVFIKTDFRFLTSTGQHGMSYLLKSETGSQSR